MFALIVAFFSGIVAHQTDPLFNQLETDAPVKRGWLLVGRYVVGVVGATLPYLMFRREQRERNSESWMDDIAYWFLLWSVYGIGTRFGHLIDWIRGKNGVG